MFCFFSSYRCLVMWGCFGSQYTGGRSLIGSVCCGAVKAAWCLHCVCLSASIVWGGVDRLPSSKWVGETD